MENNQNLNDGENTTQPNLEIFPDNTVPANPTPINPVPVNSNPVDPMATNSVVMEPTPINPTPVDPMSTNSVVMEPTPINPISVEPTPANPSSLESIPTNPTQVEPISVNPNLINPLPATEPNNLNTVYDSGMNEKPKSKLLLIIGIIILVVGLAVGTFFFINEKKISAKETFTASINNQIKQFNEFIKKADQVNVAKKIIQEKGTMKLHFEVDSNNGSLELISGYKFDMTAGINIDSNEAAATLNVSDKNNNKFDVNYYLDGKYQYADFGDLYDKVVKEELAEALNFKKIIDEMSIDVDEVETNGEDISYLIEKLVEASMNSTVEKDFTKEKTTKKIFGEDLKLTKTSYVLTAENFEKLAKSVASSFSKDEKALKILADYSGELLTVKDIKEVLENSIKNFKTPKGFEEITFILYTNSKHEAISLEIKSKGGTFTFTGIDKKFSITLNASDNSSLLLSFGEKEKDTLIIDLVSEGLIFNGVIKIVDKSTADVVAADLDFDIKFKGNMLQSDDSDDFDDWYSDDSETNDWSIDGWGLNNFTNKFKRLATNDDFITFKAKINYSVDNTFNFSKPNLMNTIEFENMTPDEYTQFSDSLSKNKLLKDSGLLDAMEVSDYDNSYEYEFDPYY